MREIKFSAWDKDLEQMIYQGDDDYDFILTEKGLEVIDKQTKTAINSENMQFTGLNDKNKVEIYQSDIVYDVEHEEYAVVVIEEGCTWFKFETHNEYAFDRCDILEVVGNIYENPELVKENEK